MSSQILDRLEAKLDKQSERLSSIDITLAKQAVSIDEHIRRTNLLEESIKAVQADVKPLQRAHFASAGVAKAVAYLGGLVATAAAVIEIIHALHHH